MKRISVFIFVFMLSISAYAEGNQHRVGGYIGAYIPSGDLDVGVKFDFKAGYTLGVSYHYLVNENFRVGGFLDMNGFSSEEQHIYIGSIYNTAYVDFDFFTAAFGLSLEGVYPVNNMELFVRGDLGMASNSATMNVNWDSYANETVDDDGTALYLGLEGGMRFYVSELVDLGLSLRYVSNKQKFEELDESVQLGGLMIKANLGLNF